MLLASPQEYLYQMKAQTRSEARRKWKEAIKEKWNHVCAYCGEHKDQMSLDHIHAKAMGGNSEVTNVLCACVECNKDKGHKNWEEWYINKYFFSQDRYDRIKEWQRVKSEGPRKRLIRGSNGMKTRIMVTNGL
tara:strand:- start:23 stop:421 length:399 start_codon:yes stop_codon:yes gene_type:complete